MLKKFLEGFRNRLDAIELYFDKIERANMVRMQWRTSGRHHRPKHLLFALTRTAPSPQFFTDQYGRERADNDG